MNPSFRFSPFTIGRAPSAQRRIHADRDAGRGRHRRRALEHRLSEPRRPGHAGAPHRRARRTHAGAARARALSRQQRQLRKPRRGRRAADVAGGALPGRRSSRATRPASRCWLPPSSSQARDTRCRHLRLARRRRDADLRIRQRRDHRQRPPTPIAPAGAGDGAPRRARPVAGRAAGRRCRRPDRRRRRRQRRRGAPGRGRRRAQVEARLMQDLRGAAELVARDLRRAGHWAAAASGVRRWRRADQRQSARRHRRGRRQRRRRHAQLLDRRRRCVERRRRRATAFACATARSRCSSVPATGRRSATRERSSSHRSPSSPRRRNRSRHVLRQAVQRRQHDLPAAPASAQLRHRHRRPRDDRCARARASCAASCGSATTSSSARARPDRHVASLARSADTAVASLGRASAASPRCSSLSCSASRWSWRSRLRIATSASRTSGLPTSCARRARSRSRKPGSSGRSRASTIRPRSAPIACRAPRRQRARFANGWFAIDVPSRRARAAYLDGRRHARAGAGRLRARRRRLDLPLPERRPARAAGDRGQRHGACIRRRARRVDARPMSCASSPSAARAPLPARPARRASTPPAKRPPGSKPPGRCCRRCAPRPPQR